MSKAACRVPRRGACTAPERDTTWRHAAKREPKENRRRGNANANANANKRRDGGCGGSSGERNGGRKSLRTTKAIRRETASDDNKKMVRSRNYLYETQTGFWTAQTAKYLVDLNSQRFKPGVMLTDLKSN